MVTIILLSHGRIAEALRDGAEMIVGEQERLLAFGLFEGDSPDTLRGQLEKALDAERGNEVLVFTDVRSGSPFNIAVSLMEKYGFRHISGINLGVLLEALLRRTYTALDDLCDELVRLGPTTFLDVNSLLEE